MARGDITDRTAAENATLQRKYYEFARAHAKRLAQTKFDSTLAGHSASSKEIYSQYKTAMLKIQQTLATGEKVVSLEEGRRRKLIVLGGETQFCEVYSERRFSPLKIGVKEVEGQFEIFVSERTMHPCKANCEMRCCFGKETGAKVAGNDSQTQTEEEMKEYLYACRYSQFQSKRIYLGIFATTHSVLKLEVQFARKQLSILFAPSSVDKSSRSSSETVRFRYGVQAILDNVNSQLRQLRHNKGMLRRLHSEVALLRKRREDSTLALAINRENIIDRNIRRANEARVGQHAVWSERERFRQNVAQRSRESQDSNDSVATWIRVHRNSVHKSTVLFRNARGHENVGGETETVRGAVSEEDGGGQSVDKARAGTQVPRQGGECVLCMFPG